jgi:protein kinase A
MFQTEKHMFFVMELADRGDLFRLVSAACIRNHDKRGLDEPTAQFFMAEIVAGVAFLHEHDIIYRDLKPEVIVWFLFLGQYSYSFFNTVECID